MSGSNIEGFHPFSGLDSVRARLFKQSSIEKEPLGAVRVEVRGLKNIKSGKDRISLAIDRKGLEEYVNGRLIEPIDKDFPRELSYEFDASSLWFLKASQKRKIPGVYIPSSVYNPSRTKVIINVPTIWESLGGRNKTEEKLTEGICREIVYQTNHLRQESNSAIREDVDRDRQAREVWRLGGEILAHVNGALIVILFQDLKDTEKLSNSMSDQKFSAISEASMLGSLAASVISKQMGNSMAAVYDKYISKVNRGSYQEMENWEEVKDLIHVKSISTK